MIFRRLSKVFSLGRIRRRNRAWLRRHSYSFFSSLGVLLQHKVGTSLTVLVLGIAMFLPLGLYVTLANLDGLNLHQDEWSAVTVFFASGTKESEVRRVADELEKHMQPEKVVLSAPPKAWSTSPKPRVLVNRWICWKKIRFPG